MKEDRLVNFEPDKLEKIRFTKREINDGILRNISWLQGSANNTGSFPLGHFTVAHSYFPKMM